MKSTRCALYKVSEGSAKVAVEPNLPGGSYLPDLFAGVNGVVFFLPAVAAAAVFAMAAPSSDIQQRQEG